MAKDPAFLFYTSDFLSGISDLTMSERGQYITLLCLQHQKGHLSDKAISLATANATADVMAKFRQDPAGLWYNERLDQEIEKRKEHTDKQRQRALDGWQKRKGQTETNTTANATALPLENVNEDISKLCIKVLSDFKFSQISNPDKLRQISEFVNLLKFNGRLEYFEKQYYAYWKYKELHPDEKTQSLKPFLDGGWENKNWVEEIKQNEAPRIRLSDLLPGN